MNINEILIRPILSEKMNKLEVKERNKSYAFKVNVNANKIEIKNPVENKFDVKVIKVRTMNFFGKSKQMTVKSGGRAIRTSGKKSNWKKAIVSLMDGESIDFYSSYGGDS